MEHRVKEKKKKKKTTDHPSHHGILSALSFWDGQAAKHGIVYRLAFGSLLGQTRDQRIIPHDTDADMVVTSDAIEILTRLVHDPAEIHFINQEHHEHMRVNSETEEDNVVVLFRVDTHQKNFDEVPRVDCQGRVVGKNVDECSFTGPVSYAYI
jgi:hypothetical protein